MGGGFRDAAHGRVPRFFTEREDGFVRCELCPRRCLIPGGGFGACGARGNKGGRGLIPFYGFTSALALDPIEKKPLYHFRPGSRILSLGFAGCNLRCPFCQNWRISRNTDIPGTWITGGGAVSAALARREGNYPPSIAYTYSEPLVHIEFLLDCMALARGQGAANVLVTNGCVNAEAAKEILALTDAANIDLKSFSKETYAKTLGGDLQTVLDFIVLALEAKVHVEITTLVVPDLNDSEAELDRCADFIAALSGTIPYHLSAYHPDYHWNAPPTDPAFLLRAAGRARKKLSFVYTGNIAPNGTDRNFSDTLCPRCGAVLVSRRGYEADTTGLAAAGENFFRCASCGSAVPVVC